MNIKNFAKKHGISYTTIWNWCQEGKIPGAHLVENTVWVIPEDAPLPRSYRIKKLAPAPTVLTAVEEAPAQWFTRASMQFNPQGHNNWVKLHNATINWRQTRYFGRLFTECLGLVEAAHSSKTEKAQQNLQG